MVVAIVTLLDSQCQQPRMMRFVKQSERYGTHTQPMRGKFDELDEHDDNGGDHHGDDTRPVEGCCCCRQQRVTVARVRSAQWKAYVVQYERCPYRIGMHSVWFCTGSHALAPCPNLAVEM